MKTKHSKEQESYNDTPGSNKTSSLLLISVACSEISRGHSVIIKNQLPQRPLSLVTSREVSVGFPGGLPVGGVHGGGGGVGTAGRAQQIAHSSVLVSLQWHFNCLVAFAFQNVRFRNEDTILRWKLKGQISYSPCSEINNEQAG